MIQDVRRIFSFASFLVLTVALAACSDDPADPNTNTQDVGGEDTDRRDTTSICRQACR